MNAGASSDTDEFKDAPGPDEITSLAEGSNQEAHSAQGQSQALTLSYAKWSPQSADYHDVDAEVHVKLKTLSFFCNRPTVGALMAIGNDVSAVNAGQQPDAPAAAIKQPEADSEGLQVDTAEDADLGRGDTFDQWCLFVEVCTMHEYACHLVWETTVHTMNACRRVCQCVP